jgi:hypothetical protein
MPASRKGRGGGDAQPAPGGGGDTEVKVRRKKSKGTDATSDLFLKHPNATLANIRLKTNETHETYV